MQEINLRNYAYLGDAIWELHIRSITILKTNNSKKLHEITTNLVNTDFQCEMLEKISPHLTDSELEIAKRARNLPIPIGRRHIQGQYRKATAFETLIGYWHIYSKERLEEILNIINIPEILNSKTL